MTAVLSYREPQTKNIPISITGSKSETNRLLILQALFPNLEIENRSISDDSVVMAKGLTVKRGTVDVHHAGTAMRFLTAYFACTKDTQVVLTGSDRMKERPIAILVDALRALGASIIYLGNEGFPPLKIEGKSLQGGQVKMAGDISSQYISALMLVGCTLENGLEIVIANKTTSKPYIKMTSALLNKVGIESIFSENRIQVKPTSEVPASKITVESDWSSASYFYSIVALSKQTSLTLSSYTKQSLQGDSVLPTIYKKLGVETEFNEAEQTITLRKTNHSLMSELELDLVNTPDIAQTIAVTCFGLGMGCTLSGLHTLKIKETDRLSALKQQLEKWNARISITNNSLTLSPSRTDSVVRTVTINTYNDHRMAMAFAPLALKFPIQINNPEVVTKSFPEFWNSIQKVGISSEIK